MLLLNPETVKFGSATWQDVFAVLVDRAAERSTLEWSDTGPYAVFADVPEQRITVRVSRRILRDVAFTPRPGESAELVVYASPTAGDASRRRVRTTCVVTHVAHELSSQRGAVQTVTLVAISADGASDPIAIEDASDGVV